MSGALIVIDYESLKSFVTANQRVLLSVIKLNPKFIEIKSWVEELKSFCLPEFIPLSRLYICSKASGIIPHGVWCRNIVLFELYHLHSTSHLGNKCLTFKTSKQQSSHNYDTSSRTQLSFQPESYLTELIVNYSKSFNFVQRTGAMFTFSFSVRDMTCKTGVKG